jgi:ATP-dependent protease HslVU (ClpYQ) peptidase subunit
MDKWAIGSGADYAMGAMAVGADAKRAVEVTSDLYCRCGLGVDVLHHDRIQTARVGLWRVLDAVGYPRESEPKSP